MLIHHEGEIRVLISITRNNYFKGTKTGKTNQNKPISYWIILKNHKYINEAAFFLLSIICVVNRISAPHGFQ